MASPYRNRSSKKPRTHARPVPEKPVEAPKKLDSYARENRHPSGAAWKRKAANVIAANGGICHLCEHPGAQQIDHVIVYGETQDDSLENLRPAHGSAGKYQKNPCPVCGINCNNVRGALSVDAGRRKIQKRIAEKGLAPPPEPDEGREWLLLR